MEQLRKRIENFVEKVIKNKDYKLLDILWVFSFSIPSESGYHNNKEEFKKWLGRICTRNLQKKYRLKLIEVKDKIKIFVNFFNSIPGFLSKESFYEDDKLLRNILLGKSSRILIRNIKNRLQDLPDLNKKNSFIRPKLYPHENRRVYKKGRRI